MSADFVLHSYDKSKVLVMMLCCNDVVSSSGVEESPGGRRAAGGRGEGGCGEGGRRKRGGHPGLTGTKAKEPTKEQGGRATRINTRKKLRPRNPRAG